MPRVAVCLACVVPWLAGCVMDPPPGVASPVPSNAVVAAVYGALIAHLELDRTTVYVESTSEQYRVGEEPDNWTRAERADSFPTALAQRLAEVSRLPRAAAVLSLPRGVRVLTEKESETLQRERRGGLGVLAVSPVALSADSTDALVYYEIHCGGLCGRGALARFRRAPDGSWRFRTSYQYWVSERPRASTPAPAG